MLKTQKKENNVKPPIPPSVAGGVDEPDEDPDYHPRVRNIGKQIESLPLKLVNQLSDYINRKLSKND